MFAGLFYIFSIQSVDGGLSDSVCINKIRQVFALEKYVNKYIVFVNAYGV